MARVWCGWCRSAGNGQMRCHAPDMVIIILITARCQEGIFNPGRRLAPARPHGLPDIVSTRSYDLGPTKREAHRGTRGGANDRARITSSVLEYGYPEWCHKTTDTGGSCRRGPAVPGSPFRIGLVGLFAPIGGKACDSGQQHRGHGEPMASPELSSSRWAWRWTWMTMVRFNFTTAFVRILPPSSPAAALPTRS